MSLQASGKAMLHEAIFHATLVATSCVASCKQDFTCDTPFLQPAMQESVALRVTRKAELSSTFHKWLHVTCSSKYATQFCQRASFAPCERFQDGGWRKS